MVKRLGSSVLGHCVESFLASPSAARSSDQVYHASIQHQGSSPPCTTVPHRLPSVSGREVRSSLGIRTSPYRLAGPLSFQYRSPPRVGAVCGCLCFVVSSARVCSCLFARAGRHFRSCFPASSLPLRTSSRLVFTCSPPSPRRPGCVCRPPQGCARYTPVRVGHSYATLPGSRCRVLAGGLVRVPH